MNDDYKIEKLIEYFHETSKYHCSPEFSENYALKIICEEIKRIKEWIDHHDMD